MSIVQTQRLRSGPMSIRLGNRRTQASEWVQGRRWLPAFCAGLAFVVFALVFVWCHHQSIQTGYSISSLHKERGRLTDLNQKYKVELANLTALDRLEHLAKKELGLTPPTAEQVRVIE